MGRIDRDALIEEIAEVLALGRLGSTSEGYRINRVSDGSLVVDHQESETLFVVSVQESPRL
jgi:hypothetical protein